MPESRSKQLNPGFRLFPEKWDSESILEHIIIHYRFVFVIILLPVSFFYDLWFTLRRKIVFKINSAPKKHKEKVLSIQRQVRDYQSRGDGKGMCEVSPAQGEQEQGAKVNPVKLNLVDILDIDTERRVVRAEPLVRVGSLVAALDRLGWTLPIVPEMEDLTLGGLVMGTGLETSSHRHGLFQHICRSYELVLVDGSIVECSPYSDPELFFSIPWSYGTIGFLTCVELDIIPGRRFVRLDYIPVYSLEQMMETLERELERPDHHDFVEGIMFSRDQAVVMTGNMVETAKPDKFNEIGLWHKPWFFKHVQTFFDTGPQTEFVPLQQYYHRHSRSMFWELQQFIPFGNNIVFRYLFGWLMPPKVSLLKLTQGKSLKSLYESQHIDMLVPLTELKSTVEMIDRELSLYPLWLCPFKLLAQVGMLRTPSNRDEMFVDVGMYGVPGQERFDPDKSLRRLEEFVRNVGGFQMIYAESSLSRDEFRTMFDHTLYDRVREKLGCKGNLPEVYDKVSRRAKTGAFKGFQNRMKKKFDKLVD